MAKRPKKTDSSLDHYFQLMKEEGLEELEISEGKEQIKLVRESRVREIHVAAPGRGHHAPAAKAPAAPVTSGIPVKAPIGGVFYRSPSPANPAFVKEGDTVPAGKTLCIIEAMKVMNEISAPSAGIVSKICIQNGKSVEANQTIFILEPIK